MVLYGILTALDDFRHNTLVLPMDVDSTGLINSVRNLSGSCNGFKGGEGFSFVKSSFAFRDLSVNLYHFGNSTCMRIPTHLHDP